MKKILKSLLVCMVMIATVLLNNSYVKAEDTIEVYDGVKYRVNNEQKWASICGYSGDATDLEIPFMVGRGIIVSQIDDHAFDGCASVRILTLPDTIVKVGDMSFIGMDNLQAVISKAQGINIVVRDNVKIVTDRSQLDSNDINNDDNNNNNNNSNSNSSSNTNGGNTQSNDNGDSSSSGNGDSGSSSVGSGGAIIDSDNNVIIDSSNGTVIEENVDKSVGDSSATISSSDNKKDNNKSTQAADSKNDTGSKTTKKFSAPKIIAYIVCVIVIIGLAAGAIIFIKKKRR